MPTDAILSPLISAIADAVVERLASARTERGAYTLQEAADWLGVSLSTMKGLVASRAVPSVKVAGCRRVPVADLQRYIDTLPRVERARPTVVKGGYQRERKREGRAS